MGVVGMAPQNGHKRKVQISIFSGWPCRNMSLNDRNEREQDIETLKKCFIFAETMLVEKLLNLFLKSLFKKDVKILRAQMQRHEKIIAYAELMKIQSEWYNIIL